MVRKVGAGALGEDLGGGVEGRAHWKVVVDHSGHGLVLIAELGKSMWAINYDFRLSGVATRIDAVFVLHRTH